MKDGTSMKVGIMGHGVVGSGVAKILMDNAELIQARVGEPVEICKILELRDFDVPYAHLFTKDSKAVTEDPQIDIVVECMGGVEPAFSFSCDALRHGKHVVTSNKELVVAKGSILESLATDRNVNYLYEASVGGGIPIVRPLQHCLSANRIGRIAGILNGTTNYILTRMQREGIDFQEALQEAQLLGYAERNPEADVQGYDAKRKICILAHVAFGSELDDSQISCHGITHITNRDFVYASELGMCIKLLAVAVNTANGYYAYVGPTLLPANHPLSVANDVFNAIMVTGDMVGDTMFYGRGAGTLPTASAICADIIDCAWHVKGRKAALSHSLHQQALSPDNGMNSYLLRVLGNDVQTALEVFKGARIVRLAGVEDEFALITPQEKAKDIEAKRVSLSKKATILQCMYVLDH